MRALPLAVSAVTVTSALGAGVAAHAEALRESRGGLRRNDFTASPLETWIGRVDGPRISSAFPDRFRAARLPQQPARLAGPSARTASSTPSPRPGRVTAADRIAVLVGTSTASIGATEDAYRALAATGSRSGITEGSDPPRRALARPLRPGRAGARGRLHHGRNGLLVERQGVRAGRAADPHRPGRCRDRRRRRYALRQRVCSASTRSNSSRRNPAVRSTSRGTESASARRAASRCSSAKAQRTLAARLRRIERRAPHVVAAPEGLGARLALHDALASAGLEAADVGYINLHGTASARNDEVEAAVVAGMFPASTHAGSTKGWTGHTLGAAGFLEAAISLAHSGSGCTPGMLNTAVLDPACGPQIQRRRGAAVSPVRALQFVRLRRQQLRPRLRRRAAAVSSRLPAPSSTASRSGRRAARLGRRIGRARRRAAAPPAKVRRPAPALLPPPNGGARRIPLRSRSRSRRAPARPLRMQPAELASVFATTHGDLAITDYLCANAARIAAAHVADAFPQLRPQRCGRLLVHRHRLPCAVHDRQRGRVFVRRRTCWRR